MSEDLYHALGLWGLQTADAKLIARRENSVWRVDHLGQSYALRFHRPGYRSAAELVSELQWMTALAEAGLSVPRPIARDKGTPIGVAGSHHVSLLTWLDGAPIGTGGALRVPEHAYDLSLEVGQAMARLHDATDAWTTPASFTRPDWRAQGLLGDAPLWRRSWDHPDLTEPQKELLCATRDAAQRELQNLTGTLDQGLIHADLLAENVMHGNAGVSFIDFDDAAFGFRDFELATYRLKFRDRDYYHDMRAGLLAGYADRRAVAAETLDFMILLRALTYPGWIMTRLLEPGGQDRSRRAIATALDLADAYLNGRTR